MNTIECSCVIEVYFGKGLSEKIDTCCLHSQPEVVTDRTNFHNIVHQLVKYIPWREFTSINITNYSSLKTDMILVAESGGIFKISFKQIDMSDEGQIGFIVDSSFDNNIDSAAYWLGCLLK